MTSLRVEETIKWIKNSEDICVLFHIDSDGITSAYLFNKLVEHMGKKVKTFYASAAASLDKRTYEKAKNHDLVVFLDLSVDGDPEYVKKLSEVSKVVIIDHHLLHEDLNTKNLIHISTKLLTEDYYPASYFVYNLFKDYVKSFEEYDWIAAIGLIGDGGARLNTEFMDGVLKKYNISKGKCENYTDTHLGYLDLLVGCARMYSGGRGAMKALKILLDSGDMKEFEENSLVLKNWYNKVEKELQSKMRVFERNAKKSGNLLYYHFSKPKYNIGAALSTNACIKHKDKLVVITMDVNPRIVKIHAKSNTSRFNTFEILEKIVPGLKSSTFGGHIPASGGSFDSSELKEFQKRLFELAKTLK